MGIYLLVGVLKSPLEADQAEVIIAGVLLALATILLFLPDRATPVGCTGET
jgi:hypothetical protein